MARADDYGEVLKFDRIFHFLSHIVSLSRFLFPNAYHRFNVAMLRVNTNIALNRSLVITKYSIQK
jgi:hypothetical protein